jgi:pimeloyl-ACP methyl ester carboxylesterase
MSGSADQGRVASRVALPDVRLHVEDSAGPGPTVAFAHGLFWDTRLFAPQVERLSRSRRCIAWDHRGQGRSEVTASGYDMDTLARDAIALLERLGTGPVHFVGLSMGGFVALRVALARPDLVRSLVLIDTSADAEPPANRPRYRLLRLVAGWFGLGAVIGRLMPILFGPPFLADPARAGEREEYRRRLLANDRVGILRAVDGVLGRAGVADRLGSLRVPTLVIVGEHDRATPPAKARAIAEAIPGARLVVIPDAGHTSTLEAPDVVNDALEAFLDGVDRREDATR